jgi:hypothetical protein
VKKDMDVWTCTTRLREENKENIEEWSYRKKGLSGGYLSKGTVSYSQYSHESERTKMVKDGAALNAVVITRWADKEIEAGKEKVLISSIETNSAKKIMALYRHRSLIENCNFRELKQAAALVDLPQYKNKNTEKTARIHMLLCVFTLVVFGALVETVYNSTESDLKEMPKNIREFNFIKSCEKAKIFVLAKHYYHVYDMTEFMKFVGFTRMADD